MRNSIVVLLVCLFVTSVVAQQSIGFRDPGDIQPVLNYRLPDWKTTQTYIGFSARADGYDEELSGEKRDNVFNSISAYPNWKYFRESEDLIYRNDIGLHYYYYFTKSNIDNKNPNFSDIDSKNREFRILFQMNNILYRYISPATFITAQTNLRMDYQDRDSEFKRMEKPVIHTSNTGFINRVYSGDIRFGIGRGKVRNVTPIFKALRFRERARALNQDYFSSPEDMQKLAYMAAKLESYYQVYDRAGKYFWKQFYDQFDYLDSLSPYEHYYLADAMSETYGARFEGKEFSTGLNVSGLYDKNESQQSLFEMYSAGLFTGAKWYHNPGLNHQIGIEANLSAGKVIDNDSLNVSGRAELEISNLFILNDRWHWNTELSGELNFGQGDILGKTGHWYADKIYKLATNFTFYIENNVQLLLNCKYEIFQNEFRQTSYINRDGWSTALVLMYYIDRKVL